MAEQTWTLGSLLDWTAKHRQKRTSQAPGSMRKFCSLALSVAGALTYTAFALPSWLPRKFARPIADLIGKRLEGCPVAYLVGKKEFYNLELEASPAVLIPRPDSELVVMECLKLAKALPHPTIIDIGTGSGNLAIAVAKHLPNARVTATDRSAEALALARKNAERHGVAERMRFLVGDLFAPVSAEERFDFVLSNPPYIPTADISHLPAGVRDFEPHLALDGGADGFAVFDRLIDQARGRLVEGGYLLVEIGAPQEDPARQRISQYAELELLPTVYDYSRHPRVLAARRAVKV